MATDLKTPCGCGPAPCGAGETAGLERTRFYPRQLVTSDDLTQDQRYVREKLRRHNRHLHGWGVVCGACVRWNPRNPCEVIVEPGYVLGPYGDEIVIPEPVPFDICRQGMAEQTGCCPEESDPWCGDVRRECPEGRLYLAVRYAECMARPVRAGACGCGCDGEGCEYTRIRDSYALKLLTELPSGYSDPMRQPSLAALQGCRGRVARPCPPCPEDPWVILADITVGRDCRVVAVSCFTHRRQVVSFAEFFFLCAAAPPRPLGAVTVNPAMANVRYMAALSGGTDVMDTRVTLGGESLVPNATVRMRRADGTPVTVPGFFEVERGMTVADLLEREGDRELFDPTTDRTFTLRDLYAHAEISPGTVLESTAAALAPLEGRTFDPDAVREGRRAAEEVLDREGLERLDRELLGAPARARELPVTTLAGVGKTSALGKRLAGRTIGEVAGQPRDEFIASAVEGVAARNRKQVEEQAAAVWDTAARLAGPR